ncbi:hypothetical protein CYMTET_5457 [Cymbomonas tetramitiformis]|uniref:16S rRNA (uracil(1498)-N(3))-methyltransferase n=1 Tax=Cymbomonas tetramitiformis TaxID=36881 RepID=A0AAE0GZ48_9CHLO|nr:hypothetical protein CYMTET_5457 [Cymbomonas tetramitiformis]
MPAASLYSQTSLSAAASQLSKSSAVRSNALCDSLSCITSSTNGGVGGKMQYDFRCSSTRSDSPVSDGMEGARREASERLPRFYHSEPLPPTIGALTAMSEAESRHAIRSLRLKEGDLIELCDGAGKFVKVRLVRIQRRDVLAEAVEELREEQWHGPRWQVVAACGTLKGGRADWLVEKCTELGAVSFIPLLTERSPTIGDGRGERLQRVATAATKQSLRSHALIVEEPSTVHELCERLAIASISLIAMAGAPPLQSVLAAEKSCTDTDLAGGLLIIGPEGDFTAAEAAALSDAGAIPIGLGPLRLRSETAAIALLASIVMSHDAKK